MRHAVVIQNSLGFVSEKYTGFSWLFRLVDMREGI